MDVDEISDAVVTTDAELAINLANEDESHPDEETSEETSPDKSEVIDDNVSVDSGFGDYTIEREDGSKELITVPHVDKSTSVENLLKQASIVGKFEEEIEYFELKYEGKTLEVTTILRGLKISLNEHLLLSERSFEVCVRVINSRNYSLPVRASLPVMALKEQFSYQTGVSVYQQSLLYQSQTLDDCRTLKSYKIRPGSLIDMVYRLPGGA